MHKNNKQEMEYEAFRVRKPKWSWKGNYICYRLFESRRALGRKGKKNKIALGVNILYGSKQEQKWAKHVQVYNTRTVSMACSAEHHNQL